MSLFLLMLSYFCGIGEAGLTGTKQFGYLSAVENQSITSPNTWQADGLTYTEVTRQEYGGDNCAISAGFVEGDNKPEIDTNYLRLEKDGVEPTILLLRPDEMQSSDSEQKAVRLRSLAAFVFAVCPTHLFLVPDPSPMRPTHRPGLAFRAQAGASSAPLAAQLIGQLFKA